MSNWAIFLTATRAPPKTLNRALLFAQDFEFNEYPSDYGWVVLTSKNLPTTAPEPTRLPIDPEITHSDFAGMSLAEINAFVRENSEELEGINMSNFNWLVIDQRGLETSTCIVVEQYYDPGDEDDPASEGKHTDEFRACRLPYEQAWSMISNLSIANMGFEDFVDEYAGELEDGSWRWASFPPESEPNEVIAAGQVAAERQRREVYNELKADGYV
ncbi:hypothetical protein C8F01DRAFT_1015022 [Mycena amicta]|nr:hypothetical protein C8F01DRAFT_1015022 [Mycena amicta]